MKIDTFANRLKKAMDKRGFKPVDLVNKTKLDKSLISNYLSGNYEAKSDKLSILSKALDVDEEWLLGYRPITLYNYDSIIVPEEGTPEGEKMWEEANDFDNQIKKEIAQDERLIDLMRRAEKDHDLKMIFDTVGSLYDKKPKKLGKLIDLAMEEDE